MQLQVGLRLQLFGNDMLVVVGTMQVPVGECKCRSDPNTKDTQPPLTFGFHLLMVIYCRVHHHEAHEGSISRCNYIHGCHTSGMLSGLHQNIQQVLCTSGIRGCLGARHYVHAQSQSTRTFLHRISVFGCLCAVHYVHEGELVTLDCPEEQGSVVTSIHWVYYPTSNPTMSIDVAVGTR